MMTYAAVIVLLSMLISAGVFGVLLNASILTLGGLKKELRVDYSWFLFGTAFQNMLYAFNICVLQPLTILLDSGVGDPICQAAGFLMVMSAQGSLLTQPLLALNRYSTIFHQDRHSKTFCKRNVFFMMLASNSVAATVALIFLFTGDYGRFFNSMCCIDIYEMPISHFIGLFMMPVSVGYAISIFCAVKIMRHLKNHEKTIQKREQRSAIKETKQIVRLICTEIAIPVCLETPILIYCVLGKYVQVPDVVVAVTIGLYVTHTVTDPVVIFMIVKPYKSALKKILNKVVPFPLEESSLVISNLSITNTALTRNRLF